MNGNDMLEFEESHYEDLVETFIEKNKDLWNAHVNDEWTDSMAAEADMLYDMYKEGAFNDKI